MPVSETAVVPTTSKQPHLSGIGDFHIHQSIRLLNDQVSILRDELTAARATIASLVAFVNTLETNLASVRNAADQALAIRQEP